MVHKINEKELSKKGRGIHKSGSQYTYNDKLWDEVMETGKTKEKGITNKLTEADITTIIATMDFFGATDIWKRQTYWDLNIAKYKVYDWMAMCIMGRNDDDRETNNTPLKVLVHSYLKSKGDVEEFIADLRATDYDVDRSWEKIKIDIEEK